MDGNDRMTAAQWQRVEQLFFEAIDLPAGQRESFCDRASADDITVRAELSSLLAAHASDDSVLDRSPLDGGRATAASDLLPEGTRIGVWRIGETIGRGGAGEVYRAARADGAFEQVVALKRLYRKAAADLARFHAERQILASLDHPGIARLLDGGVAPDGRAYAVVEYVEGEPITMHCAARRADLARRLALFMQVCAVVSYAHRNLIVHRDLKPGNILVTGDGHVKLLDFGVAKRIDGNAAASVDVTTAPFTSDYAAPEQLTGQAITTATDVYALGVLLFELLTGRRPWRSDGLPIARVVQLIVHETPPSMSRAVADAADAPVPARWLAGDLDAIVAQCLRKQPGDRYPSVDALVRDLERHLTHAPVAARGQARLYRVGRLLSRYRWAFAAGALLIISLAGGLATTLWQAHRAELERDAARRAATREEAIRNALTTLFRASIAQKDGTTVTAKAMLDRSAQRLLQQYRSDPQLSGKVVITLADLYADLEDVEGQRSLFEGFLAESGPDADRESVALAEQKLAYLEILRGRPAQAAELLPKAEAFWATAPQQFRDQALEAMLIRGTLQRVQGDLDGSIRTYREAIDGRIAYSGRLHRETANLYNSLGISLTAANRLEEALDAFRTTLDIFAGMGIADTPGAMVILGNTGTLAYRAGHLREAEGILQEAITKQRERSGDSAAVAAALGVHGATLIALGRPREAVEDLRPAVELATRFTGAASPLTIQDRLFLADALLDERVIPEARRIVGDVLAASRERFGESGVTTLRARLSLARIDLVTGDPAAAEKAYASVVDPLQKLGRSGEPWLAYAFVGQGEALLAQGRTDEAVVPLRAAVALRERLSSAQSWDLAIARSRLGEALRRTHAMGGTELLQQADEAMAREVGTDHPERVRTRRALALPA